MGRKSTKAEVEYRVNRVARLLRNGAVRSEIHEYCKREWGVGRSAGDAYIKKARRSSKPTGTSTAVPLPQS